MTYSQRAGNKTTWSLEVGILLGRQRLEVPCDVGLPTMMLLGGLEADR